MRIGLNLLHSHPGIGGAWNYIKNLVRAIGEYDQVNGYIAYCTDQSRCLVPNRPNFTVRQINIDGRRRVHRILYENTLLLARAKADGLDCMHWFANTVAPLSSTPALVSVYDLKVFDDPGSFPLPYRVYLRTLVPPSVRRAAVVLPMSQTTALSLTRVLGVEPSRVMVVPPTIDALFQPDESTDVEDFRRKYGLAGQFWLFVSHYYPHKNHERLFQAHARLRSMSEGAWPLVLCGDKNGEDDLLAKMARDSGIEDHVTWLPRLEHEEMPLLFSAATALVFPSLYEGGGIPVMEAMACGCPVVASDIPTTREFAGDAALTFDPKDVDAMAAAMARMAASEDLRALQRELGFVQAAKLRPERVAATAVRAYERACGLSALTGKNQKTPCPF